MDNLRRLAFISVGRACGFAGLAIVILMLGFSFDPVLSTRAGALLTTLVTMILLLKSRTVLSQDHRKTELWMMLKDGEAPPEAHAQRTTRAVLRETYLWFAQYAVALAVALWVTSIVLSLAR